MKLDVVAFRLFDRGFIRSAFMVAHAATILRPRSEASWQTMARLFGNKGDEDRAASVLTKGVAYNPTSIGLRTSAAERLAWSGDMAAAEAMLRQAFDLDPRSGRVLSVASELALRRRDLENAKRYASRAEDQLRDEEDPEPMKLLASTVACFPGEREWATRLLKRCVEVSPSDPRPRMTLAALLEARHPQEAAEHIKLAREAWARRVPSFEEAMSRHRLSVRRANEGDATGR